MRAKNTVPLLATVLALAGTLVGGAATGREPSPSGRVGSGQVGNFAFVDSKGSPGASCQYDDGRLRGIAFTSPSAAGRAEWDAGGQWVDWGVRLQAKTGRHDWRVVSSQHYGDATVMQSGPMRKLPGVNALHTIGQAKTRYRVVETIYWYLPTSGSEAIVQGRATSVHRHYKSGTAVVSSCPGVKSLTLPRIKSLASDELDVVKVSFAGRDHGADPSYSISKGRLPRGLRLHKSSGLVTGTVSANASDATVRYSDIQSETFGFTVAAKANGQTTKRSYSWTIHDTAFVMPDYYGTYGCDGDPDCVEDNRNISWLGPKISFSCTTEPQPDIPADKYSVIVRQYYEKDDGTLADSVGRTFSYGEVFKWTYYEQTCSDV